MRLATLVLGFALSFLACVYEESLGPNCALDCEACGTCDASIAPGCGNDRIDLGEECDGQPVGADGCDSDCRNTSCGNGALEEGETCDSAVGSEEFCDLDCAQVAPAECGNNAIEAGEECDDGNTEPRDGCTIDCFLEDRTMAVCGNASMQPNEECDDGNLVVGDGCSDLCQIEAGWACAFTATGSVCGLQ